MYEELPANGRNETEKERLDRNFNELLGGLRVALPGVQVLFAFLLAVPFNQRFAHVTHFQRDVYFVTLLLTAMTSGLLIAPSAYHRVRFRQDDKAHIVKIANRFALIGFASLSFAMAGVILLVTDFLFGLAAGIASATCAWLFFSSLWYVLPLRRHVTREFPQVESMSPLPQPLPEKEPLAPR